MAELIDGAHVRRECLDSTAFDIADLQAAYAVQEELTRIRRARGDDVVGWKLGYTTAPMRAQMGIDAPNFGPLLESMRIRGSRLPATIHPRVEPEIALVLDHDPGPAASAEHVLACCRSAHLALEVVDSVWRDYRFGLEHNTADGSSAAGFLLGDELPLDAAASWDVSLVLWSDPPIQGGPAADPEPEARGRASMQAAAEAAAWLATELGARGRQLRPGDIVLTGGATQACPLPTDHLVDVVARARATDGSVSSVALPGRAG